MACTQILVKERDSLQARVDELQQEVQRLSDLSESRLEVLQTLMLKAEGSSTQSSTLVQDNAQLQSQCKV
jgi:hypothetical protein